MTAAMTRDELIDAINALPDAHMVSTYYVDGDGDTDHTHAFCREHAVIVAKWTALEHGFDTWICAAWSETDSAERCAFGSCDRPLRSGSLTSYGVDSALALTEEDPLASSVSPAELVLSADSMVKDDQRWATWMIQARRVLRRNARKRTR